ncbi:hypothetical protein ACVWZ4_001358 [Bradyrhizobium sp. USDA 4472]
MSTVKTALLFKACTLALPRHHETARMHTDARGESSRQLALSLEISAGGKRAWWTYGDYNFLSPAQDHGRCDVAGVHFLDQCVGINRSTSKSMYMVCIPSWRV